ncbi:MAG TPA: hypothetical protein VLW85_19625 [Myxococcales bacterium]|nr:hypothetical protein [Myxococcales bacterium]
MKKLLALVLFCTGCPETAGLQCPAKTSSVGNFNISFLGQHDAGECIEFDGGADGGNFIFTTDSALAGTFCVGNTASDGGSQVWLMVVGASARSSDLSATGGFHFGASTAATTGICGSCLISVDESFDGTLMAGDAGATLQADGGLPAITSITGSLVDQLSNQGGGACVVNADAGVSCNTPCNDSYTVQGNPF